jgi:hypothetical protein
VAGWQVKSLCHDGWWQPAIKVGDSVPMMVGYCFDFFSPETFDT